MNTHRPFLAPSRDELVRTRAKDFAALARHLMLHGDAAHLSEQEHLPDRVRTLTKAAVMGGTLADMSALNTLGQTAAGWLETLRQQSVFDAMLPSMRPAVVNQPFSVSATALVADEINEAAGKPVSSLNLTSVTALAPHKVSALVVITRELARFSDAAALIDLEIRNAVAAGTDNVFLSYLVAQTTPTASAGSTTANTVTDIGALLDAVLLGSTSRSYFIFSPTAAKKLALKQTNATFAWPGATALGGTLAGIPLLVSDGPVAKFFHARFASDLRSAELA